MIFESHAHYDDEAFDEDRKELLDALPAQGIGRVINVCAEVEGWDRTVDLMERYPYIYGAVGVHPDDVGALDEEKIQRMHQIYWDKENHEKQIYWFERQLEVAREEKLPFIIHSRDAAKDTLDTMKRLHAGDIGGVVHCFSYGKEMAREYLDMGLSLGIGGVLTFKNARKLVEVVEYAPLESLLLETDSPYLAPIPNRGKRNSSLNIPYVVEKIAEIKGVSREEVEEVTWKNSFRVFSKGN